MACACKVNQQLSYLEKKYGVKVPENKETHIKENIKLGIKNVLLLLLVSPILLIMLPFTLIKSIFSKGKSIDINKIFKIRKDDRDK